MGDLSYLIEIIARLRDEASPRIAALRAEIDKLKGTQDAERATQDLSKSVEDLGNKSDKTRKSQETLRTEHERSRRAAEDASRGAKTLADDVDRSGRSHDRAASSVSGHTRAQQEFADALSEVRRKAQESGDGVETLEAKVSKLHSSWRNLETSINSGSLSKGESALKLRQYASEMRSLAKDADVGSDTLRTLAGDLERVDKYLRKSDYGASGSFLNALKSRDLDTVFNTLDKKVGDLGIRITGVASFFTGLFELIKIGFSQQLITGVVSLAGGLFSLASAATQAGAALAGAFVSGIGQAIPMLSIIAASVERFKTILQAVSVAGQAEQQKFFNPNEKQVAQLQNISQLISSQQQLSNSYIQLYEAQQRVRDSQIALTEARYDAIRNITQLSLAEKDARLQAEGAELSLSESRRQLQIDIQRGDVANLASAELAVKQAELGQKRAQFEIPKAEREARLARERGVSGSPAVIAAERGLEGSRLAVTQAQQAAGAARRQEEITRLQQASRSSRETQYESQLKFLEKGMSPVEKQLTNSLIELQRELKKPGSPIQTIADYLVEPFAGAIKRIQSLLKTSSFLGPIDELAKSMGSGIKRIENAIFGERGTSFFETMAKDATSNIPIITSAIEHLMHLFEDIAKAAAPAFHKLSEDWDKFWGVLDNRYSSVQGLNKLEEFFNKSVIYAENFAHLGKALIELFLALGHDAAPQGLKTITTLTGTIEAATKWVKENTTEVTKFFKETREGLSLIGQVLVSIGFNLIKVFSLSSLSAFSAFITEILLPALRDVINILGWITKALLNIVNAIPGGKSVLEGIAGLFLGLATIVKVAGPIMETVKALKALYLATKALLLMEGVSAAWSAAKSVFIDTGAAAAAAAKTTGTAVAAEGAAAGVAEGEVAAANVGLVALLPEITAAAAVVAGVYGAVKGLEALGIFNSKSYEKPGTRIESVPGKPAHSLEETENYILNEKTNIPKPMDYGKTELREIGDNRTTNLESKRSKANSVIGEIEKNFGQLLSYTGPILPKIASIVEENSEKIRKTLGTSSLKGKEALKENFSDAIIWIEASMKRGKIATSEGMEDIRKLLSKELKAYGVDPASINKAASFAGGVGKSISKGLSEFATGGYIQARPGGQIARVGEAGHDEVVLSTDPKHASRSRQLLGQFFSRAPHMAEGGPVGYESPFHGAIRWGRSDQGTDVNLTPGSPITAIGDALIKGIIPNWYQGQPFLWYELLSGADKGKDIYVAEQINKLARIGQEVRAGQPVAYYAPSGTGLETGWATSSGQTLARVTSGYSEGQATPAGKAFTSFLQGLASGKVIAGQMGSGLQQIVAPIIKGGGEIGKVGQAALNLATKAANIYLEKHLQSSIEEQPLGAGTPAPRGQVTSWLAKALEITNHYSASNLNALYGRAIQESSGNPLSINLWDSNAKAGHPSKGLLQVIPETFASYMLKGFGDIWNPVDNAIAAIRYMYARYGHIVGPSGSGYDVGGSIGRAPWGGRAVPIIAHEGERIMNPAQYDATARMAGMSPGGLDSYLGFNGSPRQSFASGGKVNHLEVIKSFAQPTTEGIFDPELEKQFENIIVELSKTGRIANALGKIKKAFARLKQVSADKFSADLESIIKEITEETNGVLARLQEGREFLKDKLTRGAIEREYTQRGGRIQLGPRGEIGIAQEQERILSDESKYLQEERKATDLAIAETRKVKPKNEKQRVGKETALRTLLQKQSELGEAIDQNIEARYQAEVQVLQTQINQLESSYQLESQKLSTRLSVAQSLGRLNEVNPIEESIKQAAEAQYHRLGSALINAQGIGDTELVNSIRQQMTSLEQTIFGIAAERISNIQNLIQRESGLRESYSQINLSRAKIAAQIGNYSEAGQFERAGLEERSKNLLSTRAEEEQLKAQAAQEGDTAAVISLTEELSKNSVEISENNLALKESTVVNRELVLNQIQATGQFKSGIYSAAQQGLETLGKITGSTNVAGLLSAAKGRERVLGGERSALERQAAGIGLGVEGMTPAQILSYLASPEGQAKLSQLESKEDKAEKEQMYKLVSALETNSINTLKNAEEIAKLNGQLNQPQSFSTAAYNSFRDSFFTGMGNLLPQYSAALPPGFRPEGLPVYGSGSPGMPIGHGGTHIGQINLTHPVERFDPGLFGEELSYHIATTQPTS